MGQVRCAACLWPVEVSAWNASEAAHCRRCGQLLRAYVFPAIHRTAEAMGPEAIREDNEASCFYHPESRAALPCDECGRFLCPVCDCPVDGRHLCPNCLNSAAKTKTVATFDNRRVNYDSIAVTLSAAPVFLWPATLLTCITGPAAVYYSIKHWKSPRSVIPRRKWRFVLAIIIGLGLALTWVGILVAVLLTPRTR